MSLRSGPTTDDDGSASLLVVVHLTVLLVVGVALAAVAGLYVAERRAQSAADLAALAGAAAVRDGADGCAAASEVAEANDAHLVTCRSEGREIRIRVEVDGPRWAGRQVRLSAQARAGPSSGEEVRS